MEYSKIKRLLDIIMAISLSISLSPILLIISILVKLDSKGPVIFKQKRLGKNGEHFDIYKFRTMSVDNNLYNFSERDKVTKFGKMLRKFGIDEIPQLINIIKGDMSFVGPRPLFVDFIKYYTDEQKKYLQVTPGIFSYNTGACKKENILVKNKLDIKYVDNYSFKQDVNIICDFIINADKIFNYRKSSINGNKFIVQEDLDMLKNNCEKHNNLSEQNIRNKPIEYNGNEINLDIVNKYREICCSRYDSAIYEKYFKNLKSVDDFYNLYGPLVNSKEDLHLLLGEDWFILYIESTIYIEVLEWVAVNNVDNKLVQIKEMLTAIRNMLLTKVDNTDVQKIIMADLRHDSSYKLYQKALDKGYIISRMDELFFDRSMPEEFEKKILEEKQKHENVKDFIDVITQEDEQEYYKFFIHQTQFYATKDFIDKHTRSRRKIG